MELNYRDRSWSSKIGAAQTWDDYQNPTLYQVTLQHGFKLTLNGYISVSHMGYWGHPQKMYTA